MTTTELDLTRSCLRCDGVGHNACFFCKGTLRRALYAVGTSEKIGDRPCEFCVKQPGRERCSDCDATGTFELPIFTWLALAVISTRGPRKGKLLSSRPPLSDHQNKQAKRLYYVWRLARFHSGADVTLPMMAEMEVRCDPYRRELDYCAELVARKITGLKRSVGTTRWQGALYGDARLDEGMPWTAQSGGPVTTDEG